MKILIVFVLLFSCGCQSAKTSPALPPMSSDPPSVKIDRWKEIVSENGSFKITFPGEPSKTVKQGQTQAGEISYPKYELVQPGLYFSVVEAAFPAEADVNNETLKPYYDNVTRLTVKIQNYTLISEKDIWQNNHLGREFRANFEDIDYTFRYYLINNKLYQVSTRAAVSVRNNAEIQNKLNKFLDSFQIIEK